MKMRAKSNGSMASEGDMGRASRAGRRGAWLGAANVHAWPGILVQSDSVVRGPPFVYLAEPPSSPHPCCHNSPRPLCGCALFCLTMRAPDFSRRRRSHSRLHTRAFGSLGQEMSRPVAEYDSMSEEKSRWPCRCRWPLTVKCTSPIDIYQSGALEVRYESTSRANHPGAGAPNNLRIVSRVIHAPF